MKFLKTTAIGGFVFLLPFVIVVVVVGKALQGARGLVTAIESRVPLITIGDVIVLNVIALCTLLLICFLAGLVAKSRAAQPLRQKIDDALLSVIPGYSMLKGMSESLQANEERSRDFTPVLARFDDNAQIAFEVERTPAGKVVLYLPGCPDPWSGSVIYMEPDRVEPLAMTVNEALRNLRMLGRGSAKQALVSS